jgi:hypothetical protein
MSKAPALLFALLLALGTAAGAALALGAQRPPAVERRAEQFQRLVGGLGFGPALDLARCDSSYDPRLAPACQADTGPIAGGMFFCPHHACSIFDYPALEDVKVTR